MVLNDEKKVYTYFAITYILLIYFSFTIIPRIRDHVKHKGSHICNLEYVELLFDQILLPILIIFRNSREGGGVMGPNQLRFTWNLI